MGVIQDEIEKYKAQVAKYDAGRPTTMSADRTGSRVVQPAGQQFDPSYDAKAVTPTRNNEPVRPRIVSGTERQWQSIKDAASGAIATGARKLMSVGSDITEGRMLGQNQNISARQPIGATASTTQPTQTAAPMSPAAAELNTVRGDAATRGARRNIEGLLAGERAIAKPAPTQSQVQQLILEKNGISNNTPPQTVTPGPTISSTPVRQPLKYDGAFANGGAQVQAQEALDRKRLAVMAVERKDPTLLTAPGSRDYISPMLSEEQQGARQNEIAEQRKKDVEDVAAQQVATATTRALNDQATGATSARNLAMIPYEQRRAVINDRDNLTRANTEMQAKRMEEEGKAAAQRTKLSMAGMEDSTKRRGQDMEVDVQKMKEGGETSRAQMADSTTRRGQDIEQQTNMTNAEITAKNKALDREATLEAARFRKDTPVDRVKIEGIKAYNKYISDRVFMTPELQNDPAFFDGALKMFNLSPEDLKSTMPSTSSPFDDEEYHSI